jgi:hypothetical protein
MRRSDGRAMSVEELHGIGGTVRDEQGDPIAQAWIAMPDAGAWAASDSTGRFRITRVAPGTHRVLVRTIAGLEAEASVTVPGPGVDVVVGSVRKRRRSTS